MRTFVHSQQIFYVPFCTCRRYTTNRTMCEFGASKLCRASRKVPLRSVLLANIPEKPQRTKPQIAWKIWIFPECQVAYACGDHRLDTPSPGCTRFEKCAQLNRSSSGKDPLSCDNILTETEVGRTLPAGRSWRVSSTHLGAKMHARPRSPQDSLE